jgi:predicted transport protein
MSSKIFDSIVNDIESVNKKYASERLSQEGGLRLYTIFKDNLLTTYPFLTASQGKLVETFYANGKNILSIERRKDSIKITLNAKIGSLNDSEYSFRDVSKIGHWGAGDYQVKLTNTDLFNYIIEVVSQLL